MAAASSQRPIPLLRRPLPPKKSLPPPSLRLRSEDQSSTEERNHKVLPKSPEVSSIKRPVKSKVADPARREVRFHGDVPLPIASVVKPFKTKGPDSLPLRPPRKLRELPLEAFLKDSYSRPPPEFTLTDFMKRLPSRAGANEDGEPMISDQNYEKLTSWFAANRPHQSSIHNLEIDSVINVPDVTPRVPARQLFIEMQFQGMEIFHTSDQELGLIQERASTVFPVSPAPSKLTIPASRYVPLPPIETEHVTDSNRDAVVSSRKDDHQKNLQGIPVQTIGEVTMAELVSSPQEKDEKKVAIQTEEGYGTKELKTRFALSQDSNLRHDEGCDGIGGDEKVDHESDKQKRAVKERTLMLEIFYLVSGDVYDAQMSPMEAVVLNAMMTGSSILNLRAHFLNQLPDMSPLAGMLTHLNLSFNDLWVFPPEILQLVNLVSLKLRNNPIKEIPHGIKQLKRLTVFEMSFNLLTSLPSSLFQLKHLELLDLAYNWLSFIPSDIENLSSLRELNLEGNRLGALPVGALHLRLKYVRIQNNFTHPLMWRETATNQPQRLGDLAALVVFGQGLHIKNRDLPPEIKNILESYTRCDCCDGPMFGPGVRLIKAPASIFGIKNLPFLFNACTQTCRRQFSRGSDSLMLWMQRNAPQTFTEIWK
ncbi:leucine-rich repeat-containing protein 63-like [Stylophora pistillata]|uniref:leucine-rich repeat-containing protein 63-like n=1 Tax=Stylophora pistillata TaxID=50429 RepID=UPI000C0560D6|nr:leucine-rich repeat-containing protein 63-like [Stylophora pistillata]